MGKFASAHDLKRAVRARWAKQVTPSVFCRLVRRAGVQRTVPYYGHLGAQEIGARALGGEGRLYSGGYGAVCLRGGKAFGNIVPKTGQEPARGSEVHNPETPYQVTR